MPSEPEPGGPEITALLVAVENGDRGAFDRLFEAVYTELRTIARRQLRGASSADTLSTTALVHEAYLKFSKQASWSVENRRHFYALAARAMRSVVIDHARRRGRVKRGGARVAVELDEQQIASPSAAPTSWRWTKPCRASRAPTPSSRSSSNGASSAASRSTRSPGSWTSPTAP